MAAATRFNNPVSQAIWRIKYRLDPSEVDIEASWRRVARALAATEAREQQQWAQRFFALLSGFRFLPGGRILAGAGSERQVTLCNCFVMGRLRDSIDEIFSALREGALTLQQGGGIGIDFSPLRPAGMAAAEGGVAAGPLAFMQVWDRMCATLLCSGARRGAMMATLRCDHPDIEAFVDAKREPGQLRHFNLSVLVSDAFMTAVAEDSDWPLLFPLDAADADAGTERLTRPLAGEVQVRSCRVWKRVSARGLWSRLMRAAYDCAEPGVLFIDRINAQNNLGWCERISATNPCGEIPLPPYGACTLGSLNLTAFVCAPFTARARLDLDALASAAQLATRMLDNVLSLSHFPLPAQREQAETGRRLGLGLTGLGDALIMLGLRYDSTAARRLAAQAMRTICHAAYQASVGLARERGAFPRFAAEPYLAAPFVAALPAALREGIARWGIRNSHLCAIAPAGTISLLANNLSSGLEPVYAAQQQRRVLLSDGPAQSTVLVDYAVALWRQGREAAGLPPAFVDAAGLAPEAHLQMQAALQPLVDNAISKTINVDVDCPFPRFESLYRQAYALGLKGCTAYRPNPVIGPLLTTAGSAMEQCCEVAREVG